MRFWLSALSFFLSFNYTYEQFGPVVLGTSVAPKYELVPIFRCNRTSRFDIISDYIGYLVPCYLKCDKFFLTLSHQYRSSEWDSKLDLSVSLYSNLKLGDLDHLATIADLAKLLINITFKSGSSGNCWSDKPIPIKKQHVNSMTTWPPWRILLNYFLTLHLKVEVQETVGKKNHSRSKNLALSFGF